MKTKMAEDVRKWCTIMCSASICILVVAGRPMHKAGAVTVKEHERKGAHNCNALLQTMCVRSPLSVLLAESIRTMVQCTWCTYRHCARN